MEVDVKNFYSLIFKDYACRDFSVDNFAENAVFHVVLS